MAKKKVKKRAAKKKAKQPAKPKGPTSVLDIIDEKYGRGALRPMGFGSGYTTISTGSIGIDRATGIGGLPRGRIVELYGVESSGKTTLCLHVVADAQRQGLRAAYVDVENALDPVYAAAIGVNVDQLLVSQPEYGEQALGIVDELTRSGEFGVVVVDSVAALTPKIELNGDMEDTQVALQARMMSKAMRKMCRNAARTNTLVVFINQVRSTIGNFRGPTRTTTGGSALRFYASLRLEIGRRSVVKQGEEIVGVRSNAKVAKNKCAKPFQEAEFEITFGTGIDLAAEVLDMAFGARLIDRSGTHYSFKGQQIGHGRTKAVEWLRAHPSVMASLAKKVSGG